MILRDDPPRLVGARAPSPLAGRPEPGREPIVATKLRAPEPLRHRTSRPGLVSALREAHDTRLILVSAPAGAGKTTLLASWKADAGSRPFAWLSVDERDNDPVRFWGYVLASLRTVVPDLGPGVEAALRTAAGDVTALAVPLLVNAIDAADEELVLVLDDYHEISDLDVHRSVEFLIDHLPRHLQLAIATRRDPPLPLARLRSRAELLELGGADLRLDDDEALALLNDSLGLGLNDDDITQLRCRSEGWAAGLQLIGLSLSGRVDRSGYIASLTGDDRQVDDYLLTEVLDRQPPHLRSFLLRTSILDRLSAPLCDGLLDRDDSAELLAELERSNLFVVRLDERRRWYRYHRLFRDLLGRELAAEADDDEIAELHRRAMRWHALDGDGSDAIEHATRAGEFTEAADLIAANWLGSANRGEWESIEAWTRALPREVVHSDGRLIMARAWMLVALGRVSEIESEVQAALRAPKQGPMRDGSPSIEFSAALARMSARLMEGDVSASRRAAQLAAHLEPDRDAPWRPFVTNALGMIAYWSGALDESLALLSETVVTGRELANHAPVIDALGHIALVAAERGECAQAERAAREALALSRRHHLDEHWVSVAARYAAGEVARLRGDLDAARELTESGLDIATRAGTRLKAVRGLLELVAIALDEGDLHAAQEAHARAGRQLSMCPDPGRAIELYERSRPTRGRDTEVPEGADELSQRELTVLRLLASDLSLREIGNELYVSANTVKTHTRNIYAKLRVRSRAQAVARARELGVRLGG